MDKAQKMEGPLSVEKAGLSFPEIESLLKIDSFNRKLLLSEMYQSEEIISFNLNNREGVFLDNSHGMHSLANNKYLKKNMEIIREWIKDSVQVVIPILSLLITILVIAQDNTQKNLEIEMVEKKLEKLEQKLELLEVEARIQ